MQTNTTILLCRYTAKTDSANAYRVEAEACARDHYTYAMDTVKGG